MKICYRSRMLVVLGSFLAGGFLFSGCVSGRAHVTHFFTMDALAIPQQETASRKDASSGKPISVGVAAIRLPQYLERPQIVTRGSGNRLYLSEFNQWGGNLQKDLMRTMALNFSLLLSTPQVSITPYPPPIPPDYRVEVEVMRFEKEEEGGEVTLLAQWRLLEKEEKEAVATQMTTLRGMPPKSAGEYEGTVATMSRLWGELSTLIAEAIKKNARGR